MKYQGNSNEINETKIIMIMKASLKPLKQLPV